MSLEVYSDKEMQSSLNRDLQEELLSSGRSQVVQTGGCMRTFREYVFKDVQICSRTVCFDRTVHPLNNQSNLVKNTKYNVITFIPKVLYNQFKFFFNLFFLVTALTQLIEILKVGLFITFIGPLAMVLGLTMGKEAYDDYRIYQRDIEANSKEYEVIRKDDIVKVKSKDLKVGDIVKIQGGDRIPADMITLWTEDEQGILFLKTDQLDGETDWKLRKAIKKTQSLVGSLENYEMRSEVLELLDRPPSGEIYHFEGVFEDGLVVEKLTEENTLWASTVLANGTVFALVIYVGKETRISLGGSSARTKFGILDEEINTLSKVLFLIMVILTAVFLLLQGTDPVYIPIQFMRMLILLSSIIPISMRVNLDFAKLFYAYGINKDELILNTVTRNSNCPEELGRVKYILSDKTGTLTQNEMLFKQISIEDQIKFTNEQTDEIVTTMNDYNDIDHSNNIRAKSLKNIVTALALCHNVTPVYDERGKNFQASSPDEITFVRMVEKFGIQLLERSQTNIKIQIPSGEQLSYEILYVFPFKSETRRMGIILRERTTQEIVFYLKGADSVMKEFIPSKHRKAFIEEECKDLSMTGLRTLVITRKLLSKDFYESWARRYEFVYNKLNVIPKELEDVMEQLEMGVDFLGITGIEDKLQNDLKVTIESLRSANIRIWMITGDKIETAECISRSCGLQGLTEANIKIEETMDEASWTDKWESLKLNLSRVLIIDGKTLSFVLDDPTRSHDFFVTAMLMPAVICCRCSPNQKNKLTEGVKKNKKSKEAVLGIGDGGNDVGMIQAADVGIGIIGKEGMQAALAADFSIEEFKNLKALLLWHGRLSYKRSALLASFIIHRGFIVSIIQLIFSCVFYYASIPVFNSYLQLGYATFFTFWPVFSLILDTDINVHVKIIERINAMKYPRLYASLQSTNSLSLQSFLSWIWKASFQGSIIVIMTLIFFREESYLQLETVCFTILIITEYFMTFSEINRLHLLTIVCVVASLGCYLFCVIFFNDYLHVSDLSFNNLLFIVAITGMSWGPLLFWKIFRKRYFPTDYEKVMKTTKRKYLAKDILNKSDIREDRTSLL